MDSRFPQEKTCSFLFISSGLLSILGTALMHMIMMLIRSGMALLITHGMFFVVLMPAVHKNHA